MNTKTKTTDVDRQLYHFYQQRIDTTDFRTVKQHFHSPRGDVREIILVPQSEDLAYLAALLHSQVTKERAKLGLRLAQARKICFAVEQVASVPPPWHEFAVSFDDLSNDASCLVLYAPPAYLVKFR
jgi:hypothetical protein